MTLNGVMSVVAELFVILEPSEKMLQMSRFIRSPDVMSKTFYLVVYCFLPDIQSRRPPSGSHEVGFYAEREIFTQTTRPFLLFTEGQNVGDVASSVR